PSRPHDEAGSWGHSSPGSSPAETGTQVPIEPGTLQATHRPVHAPPQQTPSTQNFDSHWPLSAHGLPFRTSGRSGGPTSGSGARSGGSAASTAASTSTST